MVDDLPDDGALRPPMRVPGARIDHRNPSSAQAEGAQEVSQILAGVTDVNALPVGERVAVFERVHEELRRTLDVGPGSENAGRE